MILTADIGTSAVKAALMDKNGILRYAHIPSLAVLSDFTAETDSWTDALKLAFEKLGPGVKKADSVIISGNGPTLAPSCGGKAFVWMNRQASEQSRRIEKETGLKIDPSFFLPKALYIKEEFPELYKKADFFLSTPEFVSYKLTGLAKTILPLEGLEKWYWTKDQLKQFGLDEKKFPEFIKPGSFLGKVTKTAALEFGLTEGTPVLAGCPDFVGAIIGSGAMHEGQICDRTGTSEGINFCSSEPDFNPNLMCYRHPNGTSWNISGIISTTGKAIEYIHRLFSPGTPLRDFTEEALSKSKPGAGGVIFHPYLAGERAPLWNCNIRASFEGISLDSTRYDYVRSVMEGTCFAVKHVLSLFGKHSEIRIVGTPALDDRLNQIKADITETPVSTIKEKEPGLLGLGILAISSLEKTDISSLCDKVVKTEKVFLPNQKNTEIYQELFQKYLTQIKN